MFEGFPKHIMPPNARHPRVQATETHFATSHAKVEAICKAGFQVHHEPNKGADRKGLTRLDATSA